MRQAPAIYLQQCESAHRPHPVCQGTPRVPCSVRICGRRMERNELRPASVQAHDGGDRGRQYQLRHHERFIQIWPRTHHDGLLPGVRVSEAEGPLYRRQRQRGYRQGPVRLCAFQKSHKCHPLIKNDTTRRT